MNDHARTSMGTLSIWLAAVPLLALGSLFVFNPPCGSLLRSIAENTFLGGAALAVLFSVVAARREKPRKRALIGLSLSLAPLLIMFVQIPADVYTFIARKQAIPGTEVMSRPAVTTPAIEQGLFITTDTKYYDITGATLEELYAQTARLGPDGFMAEVKPSYNWNYTVRKEGGACSIDQVRVATVLTFTYPVWSNPEAAPELAEKWRSALDRVEKHEGEHERIVRNASQEVYDTLAALPAAPSCDELQKEIRDRANAVIEKAKADNDEFDRVTDHGRRVEAKAD